METVQIHNAITGEYSEREATAEEIKAHADSLKERAARIKAEADKATAKAALLDKLGITADEAALLLG